MSKAEVIPYDKRLDGLRRLACWESNDAALLLAKIGELEAEDIEKLDLFGVSELKQTKDGFLEIKFYDRIKAFELLAELETGNATDSASSSFYNALELAAKSACDADAV